MDSLLPLHLAIRPLSLEDLDQAVALELLCFAENEAASRDLIRYRLSVCPELSSGIFLRLYGGKYQDKNPGPTTSHDNKTFLGSDQDYVPDSKSLIENERLIGHIFLTKLHGDRIQEADMKIPEEFLKNGSRRSTDVGHFEASDVIGLHLIAIHPEFRGKKLATLLLHDYKQKLANQQVGSKITLLARPELVSFYEDLGFENKGKSSFHYGGEEWIDMDAKLESTEDKM